MVAKLPKPLFNSFEILQTVIDERVHHRDFFCALKNDWDNSILNYRECCGNPCNIQPLDLSNYISQERVNIEQDKQPKKNESLDSLERLTARRKASLIGLYTPELNKDLYSILEKMRDKHGLRFCPCCGEPGKPGTLDHYLPKSIYPEFSIIVENLTPMCSDCQGLKGNDVLDNFGNKIYLHPYFDRIDLVYIELNIWPPYANPSGFRASIPNTLPQELKNLVERHIKDINFIERFEEYCTSEYSDLLITIAQEKEDQQRETVAQSIQRFLTKAELKAPNYWEAIFYRGVISNQQLLDFLETSDLSEFI
jgi:5-methylcytosine-specific restriction endonuclease McrA